MSRVVALDVGTKTIGIAATDPLGLFTQPIKTLSRKGVKRDTAALLEELTRLKATAVIVGLPLELDGTEERSARLARQIAIAVEEASGLPVHLQDERYSSVEAEQVLIRQDVSRERRKGVIDQVAAQVILERWLEERKNA